jgi:hypothetical protein
VRNSNELPRIAAMARAREILLIQVKGRIVGVATHADVARLGRVADYYHAKEVLLPTNSPF